MTTPPPALLPVFTHRFIHTHTHTHTHTCLLALQPDTSLWSDGFFVTVAGSVAPWLAIAVLISAILANLSTLLASMAAYSRTLQAVAREGFLPIPLLARNQVRAD
jgi:amino acid transporter